MDQSKTANFVCVRRGRVLPGAKDPKKFLYVCGANSGIYLGGNLRADWQWVLLAERTTGMFVDEEQDRTGWDLLCAPGESDGMRARIRAAPPPDASALVVRGWMRQAGIVHERLEPPFRGDAFDDVHAIAEQWPGALRTANEGEIKMGRLIAFGRGDYTRLGIVAAIDGDDVWTIEGGNHRNGILPAVRQLKNGFLCGAENPQPVNWLVDVERLGYTLDCRYPWRFGSPTVPMRIIRTARS